MLNYRLIETSLGKRNADLIIKNGKLVNVYTGEIYPGGVAACGDRIAAIGDVDYLVGDKTCVIDAKEKYIVPGFIDAHIHPESSNLSIPRFAQAVVSHGTTSIITDLHEVGVVRGMDGIIACLNEGKKTPLKFFFAVPSHVPFSPKLETCGREITSTTIKDVLTREDVVGLNEVVPLFLTGPSDLDKAIVYTKEARKILAGHAPELTGPKMSAYLSVGIFNEHESIKFEEALERVRNGVHLFIREGSVAPNLAECIKVLTEKKVNSRQCSIITDDAHVIDLVEKGHMDNAIRRGMQEGVDFVTAIQMATLNPATAFHLEGDIGGLAPGRYADINIITGTKEVNVIKTIANGKLVAEDTRTTYKVEIPEHDPMLLNTFNVKERPTWRDLVIPTEGSNAKVKVMQTLKWIPITNLVEASLPVRNGYINADSEEDVLHIAVIERHHATGNIGKAFISGFGLKEGAIAFSMAHDNHNIVVMGADPEDMSLAANRIIELQGGQILAHKNKVIQEVSLPILGLLTDKDPKTLAKEKISLIEATKKLGNTIRYPFMFLSFITLAAIPQYAVTDKGFIDVEKQAIINPVISIQ